MKKLFTLVAILIGLSVVSFGADRPKKGKISVTSNSYNNLFVKIDGQRYNMDRNDFVVNSINAGNHRVEIYRMERRGVFGRTVTRVLYSDNVFVGPNQVVNLNVNRNDQVMVRKSGGGFDRDDKWGRDNRDYGRRDDNHGQRDRW